MICVARMNIAVPTHPCSMSIIYPLLRFELVSCFCLPETIIFCDNDLRCAHEYSDYRDVKYIFRFQSHL
jgi:hypothetical protein